MSAKALRAMAKPQCRIYAKEVLYHGKERISGRKQKAENSKRTEQLSSVRLRYTYHAAVSKLSTAVTLFTKSVSASLSINHCFSPYWISKSPRKNLPEDKLPSGRSYGYLIILWRRMRPCRGTERHRTARPRCGAAGCTCRRGRCGWVRRS